MIRALLVDDEALARQHLRRQLEPHRDVDIVGEAANGFEALERIGEMHPDVVFLDIEMPGFNGFQVVENLEEPPVIVFATAYDEYAVKAFDANALDYLLKPIQPERVTRCLEKVRTSIEQKRPPAQTYDKLLRDLGPEHTGTRTKLAVRKGKRIIVVSIPDVLHIGLEDKLTFVYTPAGRFSSDRSIGQLEISLAESGFFRISRSELVNVDAISELIPWFSGTYKVKLRDNTELDVSRERARELKALLDV